MYHVYLKLVLRCH